MIRRAAPPILLLALLAMVFASCGGGSSKSGNTPTGSGTSGRAASDEAYLKVICGGADNFYHAVQTSSTAEGISKAVRDFISSLQKVTPPADLQQFNKDFIKYLQDAVDNPTSLLSTNPPLPPQKARDRLVSKEKDVEECKNPTFLDAANTPGPAVSPSASASP